MPQEWQLNLLLLRHCCCAERAAAENSWQHAKAQVSSGGQMCCRGVAPIANEDKALIARFTMLHLLMTGRPRSHATGRAA